MSEKLIKELEIKGIKVIKPKKQIGFIDEKTH